MSHVLVDRATPPDRATLEATLAGAVEPWDDLERRLDAMGARGTWAWGGPKYGWEKRYKRSGRPFVTMTPKPGALTALVVLGQAESEAAFSLPLGDRLRGVLETTPQLHDGRWLFMRIDSAEGVEDVELLLAAKLPPTIRAKVRGSA